MTNQSNTPPPNASTLLDEARALHRSGRLRAARAAYEAVLAINNNNLQAILELGQVLIELKLPVEASALFHGQIDRHPTDSDLRLALGIALMEQGEPWIAAPVFLKASRLAPGRLPARLMLAKSLIATSRSKEALSVLQQTALDFPEAPDVWGQRGALERILGNQIEAEQSYRRQLALTPDDFNALNNLGVIVRAAGRLDEAVSIYRQALAIAPTSALVHANLGNALDARGKAHEAEAHLREAVRCDWASIDARYNLAAHLVREERPDEAISYLRFVVTEASQRWDAWTNLGVALVATGQMDEAEKCYRTAITLRPATPEPHYNLAWLLLLMGRWQEGWREYEWRWQLPLFSAQKRQGLAPPWNGSVQANATILLRCEQGLGDSIQFVRLAASARKLCKRTILECPASLLPLFENIEGVDEVIHFGSELPHHDFYVNLMSLPGLLHLTPDSIPKTDAYISATHTSPSRLKLPVSSRPKVGFVWAGSPDNKIDRRRSCDVEHFVKLLRDINLDAVGLQAGPKAADIREGGFPNLTFRIDGHTSDWVETASVVAQLDLVIGVDTAVMHLAGALGRPAWILLPASPDFRWLLGRADTPWYRSMRLFRQQVRGDWAGLFEEVRVALTVWLPNHT